MNTLTTQSTSRSGDSNRPRMLPDQPSPASRARIAGTPGLRASGPFGVLDIGTTKIVCIIGRIEGDGTPRVLGLGNRQGQGINGGSITDIEKAERAIRAALSPRVGPLKMPKDKLFDGAELKVRFRP